MADHIPDQFYCPITRTTMADPVIAADGYTYERAAITQWIQQNISSGMVYSPINFIPLTHLNLTENVMLKNIMKNAGISPGIKYYVSYFAASPYFRTAATNKVKPDETLAVRSVLALDWDLIHTFFPMTLGDALLETARHLEIADNMGTICAIPELLAR